MANLVAMIPVLIGSALAMAAPANAARQTGGVISAMMPK